VPVSSPPPLLLLASTSPYRRALLERFGLPFSLAAPELDEAALPGEAPAATASRLAAAKAHAVASRYPDALVIGSDQVADCDGVAVSKPGDHATAVGQLTAQSGRRIVFHTAVAVLNTRTQRLSCERVDVVSQFRTLTTAEIEAYLRADQPYDCAGSVRSEGLGLTLFERIDSTDPSALIGLPLIALARLLRAEGVALPPLVPPAPPRPVGFIT
jgi:septum formation protein